jgi:hypothetical protein
MAVKIDTLRRCRQIWPSQRGLAPLDVNVLIFWSIWHTGKELHNFFEI